MYQPLTNNKKEGEFYGYYFDIDPMSCENLNYETPPNRVDIYVITFNNPILIKYQIKTLRAFFRSPFNIIIIDNNNNLHPESSAEVLAICMAEEVIYLKAPNNHYQHKDFFDPTLKLGTTLTWVYKNCVQKRKPEYFGFLDQDCFLIKPFDITKYLDQNGMYGIVSRSPVNDSWNLHVTTNFYKYAFVGHLPLDFRAHWVNSLDTGGANYDILYKDESPGRYELPFVGVMYSEKNVEPMARDHYYELIDNVWYHMRGSSHDQLAGAGQFKLAYTKGYLDCILNNRL